MKLALLQLPLLLPALFLTAPAHAQLRGSLTGVIEKAPASPCNPAATHRVRCTDVLLHSSTVDLDALENRMVRLEGNLDLGIGCNTIDVDLAQPTTTATNALAILGYRLNRPLVFTTVAPAGAVVVYVFGEGPGFAPLGGVGSILVQPRNAVYWGFDLSIGVAIRSVTIPCDPNLVGVTFYMQSAYLALGPVRGQLLNATCFQITS